MALIKKKKKFSSRKNEKRKKITKIIRGKRESKYLI